MEAIFQSICTARLHLPELANRTFLYSPGIHRHAYFKAILESYFL